MRRALLVAVILAAATPERTGHSQTARAVRLIAVRSEAEAAALEARIRAGESFDRLARDYSRHPSSVEGGYLPAVSPDQLPADFRSALAGLGSAPVSAPVKFGDDYYLLGFLPRPEQDWAEAYGSGVRAVSESRYADAESSLLRAVERAESFPAPDPRLLDSLVALGDVHDRTGRPRQAGTDYERALPLLEALKGTSDPSVARLLIRIGDTWRARGSADEAEAAYEKALFLFEHAPSPAGPSHLDALERLALVALLRNDDMRAQEIYRQVLSRIWNPLGAEMPPEAAGEAAAAFTGMFLAAPFRGDRLAEARERFQRAREAAPPSQAVLVAMADLLVDAGLTGEADALLSEAVRAHPDWATARLRIAQAAARARRVEEAIRAFGDARIAAAQLPEAEGRTARIADIDRQVGSLLTDEGRLEDARKAFESSILANPNSPDAHLGLGLVHSLASETERALGEYQRAVALGPRNATAHYRVAQANLALGHLEDALAASDRALALEPGHLESRFVRARTLIRLGRDREGREELALYRSQQAERETQEQTRMGALTRVDAADSALRAAKYEDAVRLYQESIAAEPDIVNLYFSYFDLAAVLGGTGQHEEAVRVLETMLADHGFDDFRVRKNLAFEYGALGQVERAARNESVYLQRVVTAIRRRFE